MSRRIETVRRSSQPLKAAEENARASAPDGLVSRRIFILANVLRRAASVRYRRLVQLPAGEWGVIAELGHQQPRTLNDLSSGIGLDKTQLSRTVSNLIERGLVQRKPNPRDNREVLISLTKAGGDCYAKIIEAGLAANERLLANLPVADRKQLVAHIEYLTERARTLLQIEQGLSAMTSNDR